MGDSIPGLYQFDGSDFIRSYDIHDEEDARTEIDLRIMADAAEDEEELTNLRERHRLLTELEPDYDEVYPTTVRQRKQRGQVGLNDDRDWPSYPEVRTVRSTEVRLVRTTEVK